MNSADALSSSGVGGTARLAGLNRYATAATVALSTYGTGGGKNDVVLASGVAFPDGLAAAGLAGKFDSPILLTDSSTLPVETTAALASLSAGGAKRVHVIGGLAAISQTVRDRLRNLGYTLVEVYGGANRYDTAAKVAIAIGNATTITLGTASLPTAILATGADYADALSVGALAFAGRLPILLTDGATLSPEAGAAIGALGITRVIVMGGTAAVSANVESALTSLGVLSVVRMAGANRADTAARLAIYLDGNGSSLGFQATKVVLFNGYYTFADGLSAGPHAGRIGANLLPVASLPPETASYLTANVATIDVVQVIGGTSVVGTATLTAAASAATAQARMGALVPADVVDLSNWKITLPIDTPHSGSPDEVLQPELHGFSIDPYLHLNAAKDAVVFRAIVGGATTSGSSYPRSELREMNGADLASWSSTSGTHTMTVTEAITHVPAVKRHIVAAQIHDAKDDVFMIRLEASDQFGPHAPRLFVERDANEVATLDSNYQMGTFFTVKIQVSGGHALVFFNGVQRYDLALSKSGWYFHPEPEPT